MGLYLGKLRIIAINEKVATKQWVTDLGYLSNTNLSDYVTNDELQPVSNKIDDVSAKVEDISTKISEKVATKQWVTDLSYLTNSDLSDYVTNEQLQPVSNKVEDISTKVADISTKINEKVATKQWVTDLSYLTNSDLSGYVTIFELNTVSNKIDDVSAKVEDISTKIIKKGTLGTINGKSIENGNNITIDLSLFKVVDSLPVSDIDENKIYLLPNPAGGDNNTYIEYMYIKGRWEVVGEYKSDLSLDSYYTKEQTDEKFLTKAEAGNLADYVKNGELDAKVGEAGYVKTEALTTTLTSYAKKTDIPTVPTKLSELINDSSFITTYTETDPVWTSEKSNYYTKTEIDGKVATKQWVTDLSYLTNSDLSAYATIFDVNTVSDMVDLVSAKVDDISTKISEKVATKQWVTDLGYLTEHQSLADYATITYVTEQIGSINSVLETI